MAGMAPICGMLTITSIEPRIGFPIESRATTVMVLSPTLARSGSLAAPTCQDPTLRRGRFAGEPPPLSQPASPHAATTNAAISPSHPHGLLFGARLMATPPDRVWVAPLPARGPDRSALREAWRATDPTRSARPTDREGS